MAILSRGYEAVVENWLPLTRCAVGDRITIRRVHELAEEERDVLAFLEANHIEPGELVTVEEVLPFNQTITLKVGEKRVTLGDALARYIFGELAD